ncbi:MAG: sensor histidine kinase [Alphaproteobacteria bacterium]|nr:sensor histidine kinase [Alphaproteobacteria bacterium]
MPMLSSQSPALALPSPSRLFDLQRLRATAWLQKLRMHHVLFVAFTLIAAVPVFTLAWWVEHHALQQEIDAATEKHSLVARNLTAAFSRYVFDVKAGFEMAIDTFYSGEQAQGLKSLLTSLEFRHVCIVNGTTGEVERYLPGFADSSSTHIVLKPETLAYLRSQLKGDETVITDLQRDAAGHPAFFVVRALPEGRIAYGVIATDYLVRLQRGIAFGARGHAVVLDSKGKVIGHPFQKWIDAEFDLSQIPPVKAIMAGQIGVIRFYSPAYHADMITAYASVPETKWGVMVPQPMDELYAQAEQVRSAAVAISFLGLLAAAVISWCLARYISRPLQAVETAAGAITEGDFSIRAPKFPQYVPQELHGLARSFNQMLDELVRKNSELSETAFRAEAANRAKSEFLANMSHELRTPLTAVLGFSEIMKDEVFGPMANPQYRNYAVDIHNSASHLIRVITDILDLSKAESGAITAEIGPVHLPEVVAQAVRSVENRAAQDGIAVVVDIDPSLALESIETDEAKLLQMLLNLLSNAVKFTAASGTVTLSAKWAAEWLEIAVRDTGIGIADEDLEKVMTPFGQVASAYYTKEGFGLGLPLTNKLAQALGGQLRIESVLGHGTTVTIHLPQTSHFAIAA